MASRLFRRDRSPHPTGRSGAAADGVVEGTARLDRRTKRLTGRLKPGNIAIIDHDDVDRVAAEQLLEHGVAAVVNAKASITGRYPNLGPLILAAAGVPLLDEVGDEVFERVEEGDHVRLDGNQLRRGNVVVAEGKLLSRDDIQSRMDAATAQMSSTVEDFAVNTMEYVRREQHILLHAVQAPDLETRLRGRHALVVVRGYHYREDLHALRGYIRELKPVVIAVDGAADACLAEGIQPDIIFGDMDSVTTEALSSGAEILVHGYPDGVAPGVQTVEALGLPCKVITAPGTSEDVAMLLAYEQGAELVVAVGSHSSTIEFLDKGRQGMASTFLARLRLGPSLVDAKGVSQLYRTRIRTRDLVLLVAAAAFAMLVVLSMVEPWQTYVRGLWETFRDVWFRIRSLF